MASPKVLSLGGLAASIIYGASIYETTFALDKPIHTAIVLVLVAGIALVASARFLPSVWISEAPTEHHHYARIPLQEIGLPHASREPSPAPDRGPDLLRLRTLRATFAALVAAICFRVVLLHLALRDIQCSSDIKLWPLLPLFFAGLDYWVVQRHRPNHIEDVGDDLYEALGRNLTLGRWRYIWPTFLISWAAFLNTSATGAQRSTYICANTLRYNAYVPLVQQAGFFLDVLVVFCVAQLLERMKTREAAKSIAAVGWVFLFSSALLMAFGVVYYISTPDDRHWVLTIDGLYAQSVLGLMFVTIVFVVCLVQCFNRIGLVSTLSLMTSLFIGIIGVSYAWRQRIPFPPLHSGAAFFAFLLNLVGVVAYLHVNSASESAEGSKGKLVCTRLPSLFYLAMVVLSIVWLCLWSSTHTRVSFHPIDMLRHDAKLEHERWIKQAKQSQNLQDAVKWYHRYYNRYPPPNFNHWYEYATSRDSVIIDDFDRIYHDLLPFLALDPAEIRRRTWESISNPWNDVAGISIRNGKADVSPNVVPTHRWMMEGIINMLNQFAEWLPDMDIGFNINDECRVSVPYSEVEDLKTTARKVRFGKGDRFTSNEVRSATWDVIPTEPYKETEFIELSAQRTFYEYGAVSCSPHDPARSDRHWQKDRLCLSCTTPHSLGQFIQNWTYAGDICHQPDMADMHGLYLSPAAYKASHKLMPVFSQSKAGGYHDILYPSAWNYMEKAKYDPSPEHLDIPFSEKENTIFWRGATSEGLSTGGGTGAGTWRGMTRQRLVHIANNSTATQLVLLRDRKTDKLAYHSMHPANLRKLMHTDIGIVEKIVRCGGRDCDNQHNEFSPLAAPVDFQAHWRYKFLMDLDGAGFSGRFLPFLQSRSLVFKAAVFREWWDDRVTAWYHFIPLDNRLHGFWSTLAYFAGVGTEGEGTVYMKAKEKEAEMIAEQGREWANKALRKEDMEIYMFRLLLEWGRLTDDRRDELGFAGYPDRENQDEQ